jgi:hypothetical protein
VFSTDFFNRFPSRGQDGIRRPVVQIPVAPGP